MNSIISDLKHLVVGEVTDIPQVLSEFSRDFGRLVCKQPKVIVRPDSATDVARVVQYAFKHGIPVSSRAAGHTFGGQSLNEGGIVLDMRSLNQIHSIQTNEQWFRADAGVSWEQVLKAVLPYGLIPPVLTSYYGATLGGTHSTGGVGTSSFRYGTQADNCLGIEVVTTTGELLWCTPEKNSELFYHALCGFGQFGLITQVQHRLKRYRPIARKYTLLYDNLSALLDDCRILMCHDRVDYLDPRVEPYKSANKSDKKRPFVWLYRTTVKVELDAGEEFDDRKILAGRNYVRVHAQDLPLEEFTFTESIDTSNYPHQAPGSADFAYPWTDVILPWSQAKHYIETILEGLPLPISAPYIFRTARIIRFAPKHRLRMPLFRVPDEEEVLGFGIYPLVPKQDLPMVLRRLRLLNDLALKMGGKRYLIGWLPFGQPEWRQHFGEYWPKVNELKRKYDPKGILNPGFIKYGSSRFEGEI